MTLLLPLSLSLFLSLLPFRFGSTIFWVPPTRDPRILGLASDGSRRISTAPVGRISDASAVPSRRCLLGIHQQNILKLLKDGTVKSKEPQRLGLKD